MLNFTIQETGTSRIKGLSFLSLYMQLKQLKRQRYYELHQHSCSRNKKLLHIQLYLVLLLQKNMRGPTPQKCVSKNCALLNPDSTTMPSEYEHY